MSDPYLRCAPCVECFWCLLFFFPPRYLARLRVLRDHPYHWYALQTCKPAKLATLAFVGLDFCLDVLALGELPHAEDDPWALYHWALATLGGSVAINVAIVVVMLRRSLRREQLDETTARELAVPMTLTLLLGFTNLEATVMLPWVLDTDPATGRAVHYAGFPTRALMLATIASVFLEDIPQVTIQGLNAWRTYYGDDAAAAAAPGAGGATADRSVPTVILLSMVSSLGMIVVQITRKCFMYSLREAVRPLIRMTTNVKRVLPDEVVVRRSKLAEKARHTILLSRLMPRCPKYGDASVLGFSVR